jgi:hypothetical protein
MTVQAASLDHPRSDRLYSPAPVAAPVSMNSVAVWSYSVLAAA